MRPLLLALLLAAVASPTPLAGQVLTGIAVDPQGQPVAGAEVWLPLEDSAEEAHQAYLKAGPAAVTGADGHFAVAVPNEVDWLEVCAPGSLTAQVETDMPAAGPVTVIIRPGASISGQVVDAAGAPLAGISLEAELAGSPEENVILISSPCFHQRGKALTSTDPKGLFTLAPLEPGWYTVRADDGLVESAPVRVASGQVLRGMHLIAEHNAQVAGRVTAPDGSPVLRAKVSCGSVSTESDAAGRYRLTGVAPGSRQVSAGDGKHIGVSRDVELAAGENRLDLALTETKEIRGRVLRPDGRPAAGATVTAFGAQHATTAADGTFRLNLQNYDCDCGTTLNVQAAGLAPAEVQVTEVPGAVEVRLTGLGSLAGRVLGLSAPAGTRIVASNTSFRAETTFADAEGRFRFPALAPGTWDLKAAQKDREQTGKASVAPGAESALDLTFPPTHRVSGWVVDADGQPVVCDAVRISRKVPCHGDGTFDAEVEDGSHTIDVSVGGRERFHEPLRFEVASAPVDRIEVRLLAEVTVAGRILGLQAGEVPEPIEAERIGEDDDDNRFAFGKADQDGGYRVEIVPGDWKISAKFKTMMVEKDVHVPSGTTRITADLTFPARDLENKP